MHLRRVVKENPPINIPTIEPLVVGPLSPRAGSKSSLGCLTFILSAQFPKILFENSGWAGSAALGLFDDLLENIFGRTGSGNKILFVSWWVGHA